MNKINEEIGKYRWTICSLVFFATTINYLDRAVISLLKPYLAEAFQWSKVEEIENYANIEIAFKVSYAFGMLFAGRLIDKLGTKIGYALSTFLWSVAAVGHALATGTFGMSIARVFLGVTEAGNFPAAIKATAEWFPKKERALATGIFNSGANIGACHVLKYVDLFSEDLRSVFLVFSFPKNGVFKEERDNLCPFSISGSFMVLALFGLLRSMAHFHPHMNIQR